MSAKVLPNLKAPYRFMGQCGGSLAAGAGVLLALVVSAHGEDKVNFTDHVLPLIEANCAKCHNQDKKKADLDLTSFQGALKGSGSGPIVVSGNPDDSKLWKALTHAEEPFMPPNRPKLADKELAVFRKWIVDGLLETAGGKAVAAVKSGTDLTLKPEDLGKPEGPPPLPKELPLEPVVHTSRMRALTGLACSPWAPVVALGGEKQVLLYNTETLELLGILPFTEGEPVDLKFSRNGKLLLAAGGRGAKSGRVVLWDVVTGEHLMTLGKEYDTVLAADIRNDQSEVALGGPDRLVKIYSTKTGELLHKLKKHTDWVTAVAFSPNGQMLATADRNGGISLWDPDSAQELFTLAGHKAAVTAVSWRADSKLLASSSEDGTVKIWGVQEGKQVKSWTAHGSGALCVAYARDGRLLSCGRDHRVVLWDGSGAKKTEFEFFGDIAVRAAFSDDAGRVTATDFNGRVGVWNAADGKRLAELDPDPLPLTGQIAAARKKVESCEAAVRTAETKVAAAESQVQAQTASVEAARKAVEAARAEALESENALAKLREPGTNDIPGLEARLTEATNLCRQASVVVTNAQHALEARLHQLETVKTKLDKAKAAVPASELADAQRQVAKLQAAQLLTAAYRSREELSAKKREQQSLSAIADADRTTIETATRDLAAARKAAAEAEAKLKQAQAAITRDLPAAEKSTADLKKARAELDRLIDQYRSAVNGPEKLAEKSPTHSAPAR